MTDPAAVIDVADRLESFGTSRADFRQLSETQRRSLARQLVIARAQAVPPSADAWDDDCFRRHMRRVRNRYQYLAGQYGLDPDETRTVWWYAVYDDIAPVERTQVV